MRVASQPEILGLPAVIHNPWWMDDYQVCNGSIEAISILVPLDVEEAYSHIASRYPSIEWHFRSHGRRDASFAQEEHSMGGRLVLRGEVSSTEALQILCQSDCNHGHASDFRPTSSILSGSCDLLERGTWEWILILRTRYHTLHNTGSPFWTRWRMNTAPTSTCAGQYTRNHPEQQSRRLRNGFRVLSIMVWFIYFVPRRWRILDA